MYILVNFSATAQISPGDLCKAHAELEGINNCTQCHSIGNKVPREKCLNCHKEIKANIIAKKGYHASVEVNGKECISCHTDHHGKEFQIIRFNKKLFNHALTGFTLKGQHEKEECVSCHKPANIKNPVLKKKSSTYLGLSQECLSCHDDYHQGKLSSKCTDCHNFTSFKKATRFEHNKTRFPLLGQHKTVDCLACHKTQIINGKKFQNFSSLQFNNCTPCHKDVHKNKFGQDCKKCHTEESFHFNKNMKVFDHNKTNFKLLGLHKQVDCKACHKSGKMTDPIKHDQCQNCHKDFHTGDFVHKGVSPDCNQCHTNNGFSPSTFTIETHNKKFMLEGAHLASSCTACHKKDGKNWSFAKMGKRCVDCHKNEHKGYIDNKFMPNEDCSICHNVINWKEVKFDHTKTGFKLEGEHSIADCAQCHYGKNEKGQRTQQFGGLSHECSNCHKDSHFNQFAINGKTDCSKCHGFDKFENSKFNHATSRFKLDGAHAKVTCEDCHQPIMNEKGKYIEYKFDDISCSRCHS